jgi:hypothetical protein
MVPLDIKITGIGHVSFQFRTLRSSLLVMRDFHTSSGETHSGIFGRWNRALVEILQTCRLNSSVLTPRRLTFFMNWLKGKIQ